MRLHHIQREKSVSWRGFSRRDSRVLGPDDDRTQIQQLQARNQQLEQMLADTITDHRTAMAEQRRIETALRERLEQSRSAFEIAWSGFTAEPAIEEQLSSLDPGNDRARRWLLKT